MRQSGFRFKLCDLVMVVAAAAILLATVRSEIGLVIASGLAYLLASGAVWWILCSFRRLSAFWFGILVVLSNTTSAVLIIYLPSTGRSVATLLAWFLILSLVAGAGAAWVTAATRRTAMSRRSPLSAWLLVAALVFLPPSMLLQLWPLRLAFLASRQALERLADRVAAGHVVAKPEWVGNIRVVESAVDPASVNVGLITDPNLSGRSGFVRTSAGRWAATRPPTGPFYNLDFALELHDRWWYECED
jgi:hypothetical protein